MKKNIKKVKKFQKPLICLVVMLLMFLSFIVGKITNANADEINYEYQSNNIEYNSTNNSLSATNVKDAIDELYSKVGQCPKGLECISNENLNKINVIHSTIVNAYTYDENSCITGEEIDCKRTICYLSKNKNSCPSGTIIDYKVNNTETVRFHVLHDNGTTMTLQAQKNTVYNVAWQTSGDHRDGPVTIMAALKTATNGWSNVKDITLADGMTRFNDGTSANNNCTGTSCSPANSSYGYPYSKLVNNASIGSTVKARMITTTETVALGCTTSEKTCPIYLYNYLYDSVNQCRVSGKCTNDRKDNKNYGYWMLGAYLSNTEYVWLVYTYGRVSIDLATATNYSARAVVVIDK